SSTAMPTPESLFLTCFWPLSMQGPATLAVGILERAAAGKAGFELVIKGDFVLAVAPAEQNLAAVLFEEEIDQTGVDVFDVRAQLLDQTQLLGERLVEPGEQAAQAIDEWVVGRLGGVGAVRREVERVELFVGGAQLRAQLRHGSEDFGKARNQCV